MMRIHVRLVLFPIATAALLIAPVRLAESRIAVGGMPAIAALVRAGRVANAERLLASEYGFDTREGRTALRSFSLMVLRQGLEQRDPYESAYAATALASYDDWSGAELISRGLGSSNLMTEKAVLEGLAAAGNSRALSILEAFYRSSAPLSRELALQAIAEMHGPGGIAILLDAAGDPGSSDAYWAAAGLGHSGQRSVLPALHVLMTRAADSIVRVEAARSIILLGDRSAPAIATIVQILHGNDTGKAAAAALVLGDAGDPSFLPMLTGVEEDERAGDEPHLAAAVALMHYGRSDGLSDLMSALDDARLRDFVLSLLPHLDFKLGRPLLVAAMNSSDPRLRLAAIEELGRKGGKADSALLIGSIGTSSDPLQLAQIAWSIGQIGGPSAIPALLALIQNPAPAVRDTAADALARTADRMQAFN